MPPVIETESVKAIQPEKSKSVAATPPKGTESIQSVSLYNTESQQTLYLKKILTRELGKEWKEFNNRIKQWQN